MALARAVRRERSEWWWLSWELGNPVWLLTGGWSVAANLPPADDDASNWGDISKFYACLCWLRWSKSGLEFWDRTDSHGKPSFENLKKI